MAAAPREPETSHHESSHHETSRRDGLIVAALAALVAGTVLVGALVPGRAPARAPGDDPTCAEWGDGCRVCRRLEQGEACSLPGIACTPGPAQCLLYLPEP